MSTRSSEADALFNVKRAYSTLSLHDLAAARDHFHFHLMAKRNVVGTALGYYRIRKTEPWPTTARDLLRRDVERSKQWAPGGVSFDARTLGNSEVRPYSWPAVLVFVREWIKPADWQRGAVNPTDLIPRSLDMPDGSAVPVCVIEADLDDSPWSPALPRHVPDSHLGGGFPVLLDVQRQEYFASIGCLVTDGHTVYALTNRHVTGGARDEIHARTNGSVRKIGVGSPLQLSRKPFTEVYPGWPGSQTYVNLDIGLIRIDDVHDWTAQIYEIGAVRDIFDLHGANMSLRLINAPVKASGAASGLMRGRIAGLFYRYKSLGGFDYLADFLIGPDGSEPVPTRPGDSGTLWVLDLPGDDSDRRPIAIQWGGQRLSRAMGGSSSPYALATCLSTVCEQLNVDLIRDWNTGLPEVWGAVGHYSIASKAVDLIPTDGGLKQLMRANLENISYPLGQIRKTTGKGLRTAAFCPIADVPDYVWQHGEKGVTRGAEGANHFADMDAPDSSGESLLEKCRKNPKAITDTALWLAYFKDPEVRKRVDGPGLLPFRVWQIFDEMAAFARAGRNREFVAAAGILAHYVGDACQPLHISYYHHGDPLDTRKDGANGKRRPKAHELHAVYEADMINAKVDKVRDYLVGATPPLPTGVKSGREAARAVFSLMDRTFKTTSPRAIYETFRTAGGERKGADAIDPLWNRFREGTMRNMVNGCTTLAMLWDSAWRVGHGKAPANPKAFPKKDLKAIYRKQAFLKSYSLKNIGAVLK
jgi:hypothetical protein